MRGRFRLRDAPLLVAALLIGVLVVGALVPDGSSQRGRDQPTAAPTASPTPSTPAPPPPPQLPRGGREVLPTYRLVGFSGHPGAPALGRLMGDLDEVALAIDRQALPYADERAILPVFELIATVATAAPGPDGSYSARVDDAVIRRYLQAARRNHALLLLNIQPGRNDFLTEVKAFQRWLKEPDVGVALDPEWAIDPGEVPGQVYGHTSGAELDAVADYLAELVRRHNLPEKVMVYHQVADSVVRNEPTLTPHEEVAIIKSVDGIGSPAMKINTYNKLMRTKPPFVAPGFKLFYSEDTAIGPLMTPQQVMALSPTPVYVMYE